MSILQDTCLLSETKIDETCQNQQFNISNYKTLLETEINMAAGGTIYY